MRKLLTSLILSFTYTLCSIFAMTPQKEVHKESIALATPAIETRETKRLLIIADHCTSDGPKTIGGTELVINQTMLLFRKRGYIVNFMDTVTTAGIREDIKPQVSKKIITFKPSHIFIVLHGPMSYKAACYCAENSIPFTAFLSCRHHKVAKKTHHVPEWLSKYYVKKFLTKATRILVPSNSFREELVAQGFKNVVTWSHGVDLDTFTLPTPDTKIAATRTCNLQDMPRPFYLCVSRISAEKNIEAFLNLNVKGTKILVGPAAPDSGYTIASLQKKYPDTIIVGPKLGTNLLNYYHCSDVFVFPSQNDIFGITQLEALACGLPIVGFNTHGPADVVPVGCGVSYLENPQNCCMRYCTRSGMPLRQRAEQAWEDLQDGTLTQGQCRAYAERFSWTNAMDILEANLVQINRLPEEVETKEEEEQSRGWLYCRRKSKAA